MKIALVLTVKNEERILRNNLLYHKAIGVDRAFVYFDNTTDEGKNTIQDLEFVTMADSVETDKYAHLHYLDKFTSQAKDHHTARQCLNTYDAQQKCKMEDIDWLISMDADELICTDLNRPSDLRQFFKAKKADIVYLKPLETIQRRINYENVFREEVLFKITRGKFQKRIYNPFTDSYRKYSWWYGHTMGKAAFRVNEHIIPKNVHRFQKIQGNQFSEQDGWVLHYNNFDSLDFISKYKNFSEHPDHFLSGNRVEDLKILLREIVNRKGLTDEELVTYYRNNLLFSEKELNKIRNKDKVFNFRLKPDPIAEVTSAQMVFEQNTFSL